MLCIYQLLEGIKISGNVVGMKIVKEGGEVEVVPTTDDVYIYKDDILYDRVQEICNELEKIFNERRKSFHNFKIIL